MAVDRSLLALRLGAVTAQSPSTVCPRQSTLFASKCGFQRPHVLGPRATVGFGLLLVIIRAGVFFLLGIAGSAVVQRAGVALSAPLLPSLFAASVQELPFARPEFGFFSIIYSLGEDEKQHWRWDDAKKTCERNDAILKEAGFPGLTVFATNESMRLDWNVYKLVFLPQVFDGCPPDVPLCPKINFFKQKELWSEVASEAVFFLDADARIESKSFITAAKQYLELPIDFVASPDVSLWDSIGLRQDGPYNTGAYFMRLSAFHNAEFERILDMGLDRNRRASPSAPNPPPPGKKPAPQGEQTAFNTYMRDTSAGKAVRKLNMPWKMHCRTWYVTQECWLAHWWYDKEFKSLPSTFQEAREIWHRRTKGVTNRTSNDV